MNQLVFGQEDFLMYIPTLNDLEQPAPMSNIEGKQEPSVVANSHPLNSENWVKIPVAESLVVYARMWNEQ